MSVVDRAMKSLATLESRLIVGSVHAIRGLTIVVDRLRVPVGSLVEIDTAMGTTMGEVIGFDGPRSLAMLFASSAGVSPGAPVRAKSLTATVAVGQSWLGRVLDALGRPIDNGPPIDDLESCPLDPPSMNPLKRGIIREPLPTGVRVIDGLLTVGRGQRLGIFAGPGVGKSTLLASIARGTEADIVVIGLVGERGREVKEFLEHTLGPEGMRRACVVTATGDDSPLLRVRAASAAIAAAEYFRDQGKNVLLMIDSITRLAQAQRQIGLAAGEQPATKGFTPSVFALLPRLLERAGPVESGGSITGFYTVLVLLLLFSSRMSLEDELRAIQRAIMMEKQELRDQLSAGPTSLDLRGVRFQAGASLRLATRAQQVVLRLAGAHKRLADARAQLLEAAKARKAVELLREKQFEEFTTEQKRREFASLDDLMVMRSRREGVSDDTSMEDAA